MLRFFYKFRILSAIILSIIPFFSLFLSSQPFSFYTHFFYTAAFMIPFSGKLLQILPFRLFQILTACTAVFAFSAQTDFWTLADPWSSVLLGIACSTSLQLCVYTAEELSPRQNAASQGILCASILFAAALYYTATVRLQTSQQILSLLAVITGTFLSRKGVGSSSAPALITAVMHRGRLRKPCFYVFSMTASMGIASVMYQNSSLPFHEIRPDTSPVFWACLLTGPLFTGWFIERRGIFSGCVLLLFLCESPLLVLCFPHNAYTLLTGQILLLIAAGGFPVVLTVLTHYLYGPSNYEKNFGCLAFCVPLGLFAALPFASESDRGQIPLEEPAICLLFLLVLGFFCIFFAWKQRFVILKNP